MSSQGETFAKTLATFRDESEVGDTDLDQLKRKNVLVKKWTAVVRLQRKVMELEGTNKRLKDDMNRYGSKAKYEKTRKDYMPNAPAKFVMKGHRGAITCVCFHPDFTNIVTCGDDATIKIWDYETGEFEKTLKSHINAVNHVSYNKDGSLLASCSADLSIKLWNTKTYSVIRTLMGHDHNVSCVRFFPDGKLFSCSRDSTVRVWDPNTGFGTMTIKGQAGWIRDVVCSSDGSMVASCSNDHSIVIWKMPSGNKICNLDDHDHVVETVAFSIPSFDVSMKVSRAEIEGKTIVDTGRDVSTGGKYLVSGSRDKTVKVWDISRSSCLFTFTGHDNWVRGVAFHPYGQYIFSVSDDRSVRVWYVPRLSSSSSSSHHFLTNPTLIPLSITQGHKKKKVHQDVDRRPRTFRSVHCCTSHITCPCDRKCGYAGLSMGMFVIMIIILSQ